MILLNIFIFLFLKGILAETDQKVVHLWRAQGDFDDKVLDKFYERASLGEEIWIRDNRTIDFLLFSEEREKMTVFLKENGLNHSALIEDVRGKLDEALVKTFPTKRNNAVSGDTFTWTAYPSLREVNTYLNKMAATYPTHCKISTIGETSRSTPIYMFKISNGNSSNKPILVDSGMHGREWTTVISTLYFIDTIVRKFYQQPSYVTRRDWYIIPLLNPDGYDYSLTKDSLWLKNRRKLSGLCYGIDLNRNFDIDWGKDSSTHNKCRNNYCGPMAFSEGETKAFKKLTHEINFFGYLSVHSAGGKVLYPFGTYPEYHRLHKTFSKEIALAMREVDGENFINRDVEHLGKNRFGMAMEWMHYNREILHTYIIETRGHSLAIIHSSKILTAAQEVFAGLIKFAELGKYIE